ncbi:M16 family metallopeptidase [Fulvivirga sedimenti]|uniref:Insulinase family protein n=1 Tax=Fulvivirga sedimenti TaxID=2879465 RepID=A0A9X1KWI7_9BACT|nr:pitrilysin family protein [Fulvivirga sedimenti]MCA6073999.1 insulinase family protein [Fulvivirga sedimenti]
MEYTIHTLSNNIRILHKQVTNTKIVHCGFMLDIGSRDESADEQGIAHFWEHMAFKGTKKRKAFHILNRMESVGGELNAYTTKEKIAFYTSVLDVHFQKAVELLTDITFNSIFPEKQIDKERKVILEEMAMYYDSPEDAIQDEFDGVIYPDHPLGYNILGTQETVSGFSRESFLKFVQNHLNSERIVLSIVGNIPVKKAVAIAEKYLRDLPIFSAPIHRKPAGEYWPESKKIYRSLMQSHCAIGGPAYSLNHPKRLTFFTLINILGGPGMNSRLNLALREKHGFVYAVDASYHGYTDTGLFGIFFATDPRQLNRSVKLVQKEMKKLREVPLGSVQLQSAKQQLKGQLAMAEENNASLMLMMAKSILDLNRVDSLEEIFDEIRNITASDLMDIANEIFAPAQLSELIFLPE